MLDMDQEELAAGSVVLMISGAFIAMICTFTLIQNLMMNLMGGTETFELIIAGICFIVFGVVLILLVIYV